ncbi:MAG: ABC transporter permease [Sphaerobacter thermophilus]|uniref:Binding-protein-dependent transport systems inner membrane component n=1 Tax=Sphaerobacter thermophilus (strain ATCC 49802 / DSM 20745 / KCCM 41009 / NCIMB 13125 / S 6022) TaxID=479434 RepID=D1C965_SPHTD|nr:ABC transporter permease [Sphaerobacter thermophilus]ACZ40358.1 binding-protein-dependent transport systems inner membrane component [Sphaerobacter thermophilus DSM 20745]PZN66288.1 MAG: ABC transporter permease [Sphaerobacter thermophilus]
MAKSDDAVVQAGSRASGGALTEFGAARPTRRRMPRALRSLLQNRLAVFGALMLVLVVIAAIAAPVLSDLDPRRGEILASKKPPAWSSGGSSEYLLGTDALGRDIYTRILYGARISLVVGIVAVLIAGAIGVTLGLISGYYGGRIDDIIMRIAEIQLAVPFILFAIAILAVLGQGLDKIIITLGVTGWVTYGRVVRGQVLSWKQAEFVEAARAIGARDLAIMVKHILPNTFASIIVIASFAVASTILAEASLSFLGLGVPPDVPTWGGMVAAGRDYILSGQWWMYTFPGIAIMLTVLGINTVGDWLRDYLDPRLNV